MIKAINNYMKKGGNCLLKFKVTTINFRSN